jgi:hypothetical protein
MIMNAKKKHLVIAVLFVGLIMLNGCKKSEPAHSETSGEQMQGHEGHEHAAMMDKPAEAVAAVVEQTTCPIMEGNAIDKDIFTEYKGKNVYFCCNACIDKFEENPEKYIAKLPQFKN